MLGNFHMNVKKLKKLQLGPNVFVHSNTYMVELCSQKYLCSEVFNEKWAPVSKKCETTVLSLV